MSPKNGLSGFRWRRWWRAARRDEAFVVGGGIWTQKAHTRDVGMWAVGLEARLRIHLPQIDAGITLQLDLYSLQRILF